MDDIKCKKLKAELSAQAEPQIVPVDRFFDGNDDMGSIGCNLPEHPGIGTFRDVLAGLLRRSDVEAVFAQIYEVDPGPDSWPFADLVLVARTISVNDLRVAVNVLEPDQVSAASDFSVSPLVAERHKSPILAIWWD